jgi:hypothetical protein
MSSSKLFRSNQTLQDSPSVKIDKSNSIRDGAALSSVEVFLTLQESMEERETERIHSCKISRVTISIRFMEEVTTSLKRSNNMKRIQVGFSIFTS